MAVLRCQRLIRKRVDWAILWADGGKKRRLVSIKESGSVSFCHRHGSRWKWKMPGCKNVGNGEEVDASLAKRERKRRNGSKREKKISKEWGGRRQDAATAAQTAFQQRREDAINKLIGGHHSSSSVLRLTKKHKTPSTAVSGATNKRNNNKVEWKCVAGTDALYFLFPPPPAIREKSGTP